MRIIALFLWLLVPAGLFGAYSAWGSPHVVFSYGFVDNGDPHNPYLERHYTWCIYLGWGWRELTVPAQNGDCPWVRFFKEGA